MGEALLSRLVSQKMYQPTEVIVGEKSLERRNYLAQQYGISVTDDNRFVVAQASVLMLAIKPQVFAAVTSELAEIPTVASAPLIISILAGVSLSQLEKAFPQFPVIRAMPNTPATVGAGMTALSLGTLASERNKQTAQQLFSAVGEVVEVPETLMDAVTGLSGSGPAYVALLVEALSDGGVAAGLPREIATQLALQTVRGTVQLLQETRMHPAQLKDQVTSPGGTTIAGVTELERAGFRAGLIAAVKAAAQRSQELGARD